MTNVEIAAERAGMSVADMLAKIATLPVDKQVEALAGVGLIAGDKLAAARAGAKPDLLPKAQPGPQTMFLTSAADIVIYGGAAGGGKTMGLFLETAKDKDNPAFRFVYFRRQQTDINKIGGPWDKSMDFFPQFRCTPNKTTYKWTYPSGASGQFASLQYDTDVLAWQTAEIPLIEFDELTHFTSYQFWYMLSRNRSTSGAKCRIRAGTNPDAGSWVKKLIAPWVDEDWPRDHKGDRAESGEIRYIVKDDEGGILWVDKNWRHPANDQGYCAPPKSITFIRSLLADNPALTSVDPTYESNLLMQDPVNAARLLRADWSIRKGSFFDQFRQDGDDAHIVPAMHTSKGHDGPLPPTWWEFFGGLDWGYADPTGFTLHACDENGAVHCLESWEQARLDNDQQADKVCLTLANWGIQKDCCPIYYDGSMRSRDTNNGVKAEQDVEAYYRAGLTMVPGAQGKEANRYRNGMIRRFLRVPKKLFIYRGYNSRLVECMANAQPATLDPEQVKHDEYSHLIAAVGHALSSRPEPVEDRPEPEVVTFYRGAVFAPMRELPPELQTDDHYEEDY